MSDNEYDVELRNIYIDRDVWDRLEKYYKEDLNWSGEIENIIQRAIVEYLDKKK